MSRAAQRVRLRFHHDLLRSAIAELEVRAQALAASSPMA
jgi:hypothetical protein